MNTLKFLAFLRGYITCIFQALVKHRYSTDIVLFTQLLRKQIYKGKTYFKSTCLVLLNCRNKRGSSAFLLTNFALSSTLVRAGHRSCMHFSSGFLRVDSMKSRCRPDENPMNGRSWSGVGGDLSIPLSYRECTEKVLKRYRRATKKVLEIYQRGTKQVHAVGSSIVKLGYELRTGSESSLPVVCSRSVSRADASRFKLSGLQVFCRVLIVNDESLVVRKKSNVLNALKCVGQFGGYRKAFRMSLACVFLVSMFSLSAQTPRKDSGADGLTQIAPIGVDYYVPDDFWNQQLTIYDRGKAELISMEKFKGKPLILDFWSIYCASCISKFPTIYSLQQEFAGTINFLLVNKEEKHLIHGMRNDFLRDHALPTIYGDEYLNALFPHRSVPHYVWITPIGRVAAITSAEFIDHQRVKAFIDHSLKYEMPN
ncbi:TlpA family protein disulfide reductase [Sphingobacterium thalpophilum]|uniref:TlpA family protein disulfide reductase n=1 Tax=Sphingobacterium thalpophilum TaxID=259 RepID=UPI003D95A214